MMTTTPRVEVHEDAEELATVVAGELLRRLTEEQATGNFPQVVLTGGTIAEAIHREVARLHAADATVDWSRVEVWWGDERFVAEDDDDRNALDARVAFLDAVGVDPDHVHEVPAASGSLSVDEAAAEYAEMIRQFSGDEFALVMLGVGPDGHVASLFPGHDALDFTHRLTAAVKDSPKPPAERVTMTYEALNRTRATWLLVSGDGKAEAVARALTPEGDLHDTPARGVEGSQETVWFLDRAAASQL